MSRTMALSLQLYQQHDPRQQLVAVVDTPRAGRNLCKISVRLYSVVPGRNSANVHCISPPPFFFLKLC